MNLEKAMLFRNGGGRVEHLSCEIRQSFVAETSQH